MKHSDFFCVLVLLSVLVQGSGCTRPEGFPLGNRVLAARTTSNELVLIDLDTRERVVLADSASGDVRGSPDGRFIAFEHLAPSGAAATSHIYVIPITGGRSRPISRRADVYSYELAAYPVWSPDGQSVLFARCLNCELFGNNYDMYVVPSDPGAPYSEWKVPGTPYFDRPCDWSPATNRIIYVSDSPISGTYDNYSDAYLVDVDGSHLEPFLDSSATFSVGGFRFSPDGERIAFLGSVRDSLGRQKEVYTIRYDGTDVTKLTENTMFEGAPSWSPDGMQLAFMGSEDPLGFVHGGTLYVMNADGTSLHAVTMDGPVYLHSDWLRIR